MACVVVYHMCPLMKPYVSIHSCNVYPVLTQFNTYSVLVHWIYSILT